MNNFDPHRYTISIKLVSLEEGDHYEALVSELPDLVEYGETNEQAYSLAVDAIAALHAAAIELERPFPEAAPSQALEVFSGRVTLRMSKGLHASVSRQADRDGVSLNAWIVETLAARAGAGALSYAIDNVWRLEHRVTTPLCVTANTAQVLWGTWKQQPFREIKKFLIDGDADLLQLATTALPPPAVGRQFAGD
jgi:predicted RNase H-like HicB family nuclease